MTAPATGPGRTERGTRDARNYAPQAVSSNVRSYAGGVEYVAVWVLLIAACAACWLAVAEVARIALDAVN